MLEFPWLSAGSEEVPVQFPLRRLKSYTDLLYTTYLNSSAFIWLIGS